MPCRVARAFSQDTNTVSSEMRDTQTAIFFAPTYENMWSSEPRKKGWLQLRSKIVLEGDEEVLTLTRSEVQNLIDALKEWATSIGPKELDEEDWGLDYDRYQSLMNRLQESVK